jgi:hypothetical protein
MSIQRKELEHQGSVQVTWTTLPSLAKEISTSHAKKYVLFEANYSATHGNRIRLGPSKLLASSPTARIISTHIVTIDAKVKTQNLWNYA